MIEIDKVASLDTDAQTYPRRTRNGLLDMF